ncbi:MAG: Antibiotic biosynthesis monooxygenase [Chloroflexota bacterium]|jgi:heme-degrading monooxygenase HmoA|nr:Antibiotic biosynthesis monooxygenase [Chloroflexota bacterium]
MIERHIPFTVEEGSGEAFERFFAERYRPAATRMPGLLAVGLLRLAGDPTSYEMTFRWDDAESATAWRTAPAHEALQGELKALSAMGGILVYDVIE